MMFWNPYLHNSIIVTVLVLLGVVAGLRALLSPSSDPLRSVVFPVGHRTTKFQPAYSAHYRHLARGIFAPFASSTALSSIFPECGFSGVPSKRGMTWK